MTGRCEPAPYAKIPLVEHPPAITARRNVRRQSRTVPTVLEDKNGEGAMRLLLVEDDDHVAAALSAVLARHGFQVVHARSGEEALKALLPADKEPFGVVLWTSGCPTRTATRCAGRSASGPRSR